MLPPLPRCSGWTHSSLKLAHPYQPSPKPLSRRPAHRPFRGLLGVHSRCGLHTRAVTKIATVIRRLQTFRHLHACSGCFRLERSPGGTCTRWKSAALSRRTWKPDSRTRFLRELGDCSTNAGTAVRKSCVQQARGLPPRLACARKAAGAMPPPTSSRPQSAQWSLVVAELRCVQYLNAGIVLAVKRRHRVWATRFCGVVRRVEPKTQMVGLYRTSGVAIRANGLRVL